MDQKFDSVKDLSLISEKNWCIKVRILRMWKVPSYEKSYSQPSVELVVIDKDVGIFWLKLRDLSKNLIQRLKRTADAVGF
ncbi:uncharacterized protein DS421_7g221660 [Arachis hypogaea]|nr:uncharacterized protein DS421_7g221660 [Arachis hypogaea]